MPAYIFNNPLVAGINDMLPSTSLLSDILSGQLNNPSLSGINDLAAESSLAEEAPNIPIETASMSMVETEAEVVEDSIPGIGEMAAINTGLATLVTGIQSQIQTNAAATTFAAQSQRPGVNSMAQAQVDYNTSLGNIATHTAVTTGLSMIMGPIGTLIGSLIPTDSFGSSTTLPYTSGEDIATASSNEPAPEDPGVL